jgi:hypothetical protein
MLDEIIGLFLSLFSLFFNETPRVTFQEQPNESSEKEEGGLERWPSYINEEYDNFDVCHEELGSLLRNGSSTEFSSSWRNSRRNYWESIRRSLRTTLSVTFAIFPLTALVLTFLYFDLKTSDLCLEWQKHNHTLPRLASQLRVIGDCILCIVNSLWFPLTIAVLFGWKEFRQKFFHTLYIALIFGETTAIYYLLLLVFGVYDTHIYYRCPTNVLFFTGIICCSIVVIRNIRAYDHTVSYSNGHLFILISAQFLICSLIAFGFRYGLVPFFNTIKQNHLKFLVAVSTPALTLVPAFLCKNLALRRSSEVVHPGRSFVLLYFIRGSPMLIYGVMQANFQSIWLFIGLSLFIGVVKFLKRATHGVRTKLWRCIFSLFQRTVCCQRLSELPNNTPHIRRLRADLEIQDMIFGYSTIVLSQGYFLLYFTESFQISVLFFCYESLKRVAIGIGIDFLFNALSNFVQIHYHNIPIGRVWTKDWKRHVCANFIIITVIVSYFSTVLLSVFQTHRHNYTVRNCTYMISKI